MKIKERIIKIFPEFKRQEKLLVKRRRRRKLRAQNCVVLDLQ